MRLIRLLCTHIRVKKARDSATIDNRCFLTEI